MRLPNKLYSYEKSILSKFPIVLRTLQKADHSVSDLYLAVKADVSDAGEFIEILDCLYALGAMEFDDEKEVLRYVVRTHE